MAKDIQEPNTYHNVARKNSWSKQTTKEKKLTVISLILLVLVIIFLICTIVFATKARESSSNYGTNTENKSKVCSTKECKQSAFYMRIYMNEDVDPCDDFHSFVCGGFQHVRKVTDSATGDVQLEVERRLKELLKTVDPKTQKNSAITTTLHLYKKCLDEESEAQKQFEAIRNLIKEVLGTDWPMAVGSVWKDSTFNSGITLAKLNRLNSEIFLKLGVTPDPKNPSNLSAVLHLATPTDGQDLSDSDLKRIICLIYPNCNLDMVDSDMKELLGETKNVMYTVGNLTDVSMYVQKTQPMRSAADIINGYTPYSLKYLTKQVPQIKWSDYFATLFEDAGHIISDDFNVYSFPQIVDQILKPVALDIDGNKRKYANLFTLQLLNTWGPRFSPELRKLWKMEREDDCFAFVNQVSRFAVAKLYTDNYLDGGKLEEISRITDDLRKEFRKLVVSAAWLEESTKQAALKKVDNMASIVALPSWVLDEQKLEAYYRDIESVNFKSFSEISQIAARNEFKQFVRQLKEPLNRLNYWPAEADLIVTNAFYVPYSNSMYYSLGILASPFYAAGTPRAIKFGPLGFIAGHEITHGFDSSGKDFDEIGRVKNWWDPDTLQKFEEKASCFVEQYSDIKDEDTSLNLNGNHTLGENIADSGGLRAAYQTYRNAPVEEFTKLPGLEVYTEDQLFFIAAAQIWCAKPSKEELMNGIKYDEHSPNKYRALVPYRNFPEYSKAFGCKAGAPMNPIKKCQIW